MHKIYLYREIWRYGANAVENIINQLNEAVKQGAKHIDIHTHCDGGDVMEGFAIYNAIKSCKIPVDMYIDGVCASMATVIMLACRNIYMAKNAMLMIHAPSGGAHGNAKVMLQAHKTLKSVEANFIREYATKTGKSNEEVTKWLDGCDHWFNAQEALDEKIINGIVDVVDNSVILSNINDIEHYTASAMYAQFTALNKTDNNNIIPKKEEMDKDAIIKKFGLTSVTAESSEQEIYDAIEAKLNNAETAKKNAEDALKEDRQSRITSLVDTAVDSKLIKPEEKADFMAIGENAGIKALQTALGAIKVDITPITSIIKNDGKGGDNSDKEPKTFGELVALGTDKLDDYKKNKRDQYIALYKAEFGYEPKF